MQDWISAGLPVFTPQEFASAQMRACVLLLEHSPHAPHFHEGVQAVPGVVVPGVAVPGVVVPGVVVPGVVGVVPGVVVPGVVVPGVVVPGAVVPEEGVMGVPGLVGMPEEEPEEETGAEARDRGV